MQNTKPIHKIIVAVIIFIMVLPIVATFLYSIATKWGATILPDGLTLQWYIQLVTDPRFLASFFRSLFVCTAAMLLSIVLMVPMIFMVFYTFPKLKKFFNFVVILPFAVPPVVSSVGLIQLYSDGILPISGTFWILIFTYFTMVIPFIYRSLANSFTAIALHDLMDAARLLGASTAQAFFLTVLPNLKKGLLSAVFISFSILFGEFVFANILVGTRYETIQIYLFNTRQISGHFTSALVMFYFAFIFVFTFIANRIGKRK
ncbi:MAG: ABC transporter permease [Candidatus Anaerobiospirillum merdipullorum]|uniref:ABC transporter permease n=1 Tax=Candidatus Anaerobiospirillum merdipullorum TaxID=2838450 RepID=A0A9E2NRG1_9GAMM|nr:ABC transporter permease [Candidatus Anaerobiospirillum merdipullorum]